MDRQLLIFSFSGLIRAELELVVIMSGFRKKKLHPANGLTCLILSPPNSGVV